MTLAVAPRGPSSDGRFPEAPPSWTGRALRLAALLGLAAWSCGGAAKETPAVEIELAVAGGPDAGRVTVSSPEAMCTEGLIGAGSWGLQYNDPQLTTALGSLQLVVPAVTRNGSTREFYFGVVLGSLLDGVDHEIETRPTAGNRAGSGVVQFDQQDSSASFRVTGQSGDGVGLSATIRCHRVRRIAGIRVRPDLVVHPASLVRAPEKRSEGQ